MTKQDISLNPVILESATKEFIEKGYINASIRNIASRASVTTGAIYKRYKGKEDLFEKVIEPAVDILEKFKSEMFSKNNKRKEENNMGEAWENSLEYLNHFVEVLYSQYDLMRILLCKAEGSKFNDFQKEFAEDNVKATFEFIKGLKRCNLSNIDISYKEYHILLTSYWNSVFDMIIHEFTFDEALEFCNKIDCFFNWERIFE
jgi:AcrR family transcriptional regulator